MLYPRAITMLVFVVAFNSWLVSHKNYQLKVNNFMKLFIPIFTAVVVLFFFLGWDKAENDFRDTKLAFESTSNDRKEKYNAVRVFDDFVLLKNIGNKIIIFSTKNHYMLVSDREYTPFKGILHKFSDKNKEGGSISA